MRQALTTVSPKRTLFLGQEDRQGIPKQYTEAAVVMLQRNPLRSQRCG
jgi:hypothetical protein